MRQELSYIVLFPPRQQKLKLCQPSFPPSSLRFLSSNTLTTSSSSTTQKKRPLASSSPARAFNAYTETCASLLKECSDRRSLAGGLATHCHIIKSGISSHRPLSARLLTMYTICGRFSDCEKVFDDARGSGFDLFSWNFMIATHVKSGGFECARQLFDGMPKRNDVSWTIMIDGHMKCGRVRDSIGYLKRNPCPTVVSWTAAISGLVQNGLNSEGLLAFYKMLESDIMPNEITFSSVVKACSCEGNFYTGWTVMGMIVKTGFIKSLSVCNALITLHLRLGDHNSAGRIFEQMEERDVVTFTAILDLYMEMGNLAEARRLFDVMPMKNEVSWSAMIARYSQGTNATEALKLFDCMVHDGFRPNVSCFLSILSASASLRNSLMGAIVHGYVIKIGLGGDVFIGSSLIDMYCKIGKSTEGRQVFDLIHEKNIVCWNSMVAGYFCDGRLEDAEQLFKQIPAKTNVSWNALISGYADNEYYEKVLEVFNNMLALEQLPNESTFSSVLRACASLPSLEKGKTLHGKIVKLSMQNEVFVGTALTDMYAKSGDIENSRKVFSRMRVKNEASWTAMIQGLADNGHAEESIVLFDEMERKKVAPTEAAFLSLLYACSHCGLIERGFQYFESMKKVHGIRPQQRHYTCIVDLLARAGRLKEAERFIRRMPIRPEAKSWATLLSGCSKYGNDAIGERAARKLWELDKENPASYVLLSNIYASDGRWKDVVKVRTLMREAGLKKSGGCSWIQVRDQIHSFSSWDVCHSKSLDIYGILELLMHEMMPLGVPDSIVNDVAGSLAKSPLDVVQG